MALNVHCDKLDRLDDGDVVLARVNLADVPVEARAVTMRFLVAELRSQFPHNRTVLIDEHVDVEVVRRKIMKDETFESKETTHD